MQVKTIILALLAGASSAVAHMHVEWPPVLKGDNNPHTQGDADSYLNYPYGCCGQKNVEPCKGHLGLLDTDEGKPVVEWNAGSKVNFTLSGAKIKTPIENPQGGNHWGGSCQVGFSIDKGKTFKVATTWQGNCPHRNGGADSAQQVFDFTVPADIPSGNAVFAWTWVNREQEFFMNCASVAIVGGGEEHDQHPPPPPSPPTTEPSQTSSVPSPTASSYALEGCTCQCPTERFTSACTCECEDPTANHRLVARMALALHTENLRQRDALNQPVRRSEAVPFTSRPDMLFLNFGNTDCHSVRNTAELLFPSPGPDVVKGDNAYKLEPPAGNCGK